MKREPSGRPWLWSPTNIVIVTLYFCWFKFFTGFRFYLMVNFLPKHVCNICSRVCLSTAGPTSHEISRQQKKNHRLILRRSTSTYGQLHVFSVTKYVDLQQVWEAIWECTGTMSVIKTVILLVIYTAGLAKMNLAWSFTRTPTAPFSRIEMVFYKSVSHSCVCVCVRACLSLFLFWSFLSASLFLFFHLS